MHCQQHELSLSNKPKPIKAHHKLLYWNKMLLLLEQTVLFFPYLVLYFEFLFLKRRDNSDLNVNDWRKKKNKATYKNQTDQKTAMASFNI